MSEQDSITLRGSFKYLCLVLEFVWYFLDAAKSHNRADWIFLRVEYVSAGDVQFLLHEKLNITQ